MTRTAATWLALWLALASAAAAGVLVGSLPCTLASASRPALASPSPSGVLASSPLPGRTRTPEPVSLSAAGLATPAADSPSPSASPSTPVRATSRPSGLGSAASMTAAISGLASWYDYRPREAAAGPALRAALGDWRGSTANVCNLGRCVVVVLTDWCQCHRGEARERVIDLDRETFALLAAPSRGLVKVEVSR